MSEELLPCPFCGGEGFIDRDGDRNETFGWASCATCEADGPPGMPGADPAIIAEAWNTRTEPTKGD